MTGSTTSQLRRLRLLRQKLLSAELTQRQSMCLAMYCFDGMTHERIGLRLGISQPAVTYHISAARKRLAKVGLEATRLKTEFKPTIQAMDPTIIDDIATGKIRARW